MGLHRHFRHRGEGGGYYDSGFIQALDFFGDGPRIPLIAVSPFSKGGHIKHSYGDHASLVKFIERNWGHGPLSGRSRDNLPNPQFDEANPNVPHNMPALSDLFDMFNFQNPNARSDVEQLKSGGQVFGRIVVRFEDIARKSHEEQHKTLNRSRKRPLSRA